MDTFSGNGRGTDLTVIKMNQNFDNAKFCLFFDSMTSTLPRQWCYEILQNSLCVDVYHLHYFLKKGVQGEPLNENMVENIVIPYL